MGYFCPRPVLEWAGKNKIVEQSLQRIPIIARDIAIALRDRGISINASLIDQAFDLFGLATTEHVTKVPNALFSRASIRARGWIVL